MCSLYLLCNSVKKETHEKWPQFSSPQATIFNSLSFLLGFPKNFTIVIIYDFFLIYLHRHHFLTFIYSSWGLNFLKPPHAFFPVFITVLVKSIFESESESCSVMSDSLWSHGLYSPQNSPGQNTGVCSLSLLQGTFPTQGPNPCLLNCRWILYQLSHEGSKIWCCH